MFLKTAARFVAVSTTLIVATVLAAGSVAFVVSYVYAELPPRTQPQSMSAITFTTSDGVRVATIQPPDGKIIRTNPASVSDHMKQAIVAAEDGSFWDHPGINPKRIVSAAYQHATGNPGGGGASTITQQLVKNTIVGDEQTLLRKYREAVFAVKLTQTKTKDEILSDYLSIVFFGRNAYGVEDAAQKFFGVSAAELTVPQSALLAGVVQSPSLLNPDVNPEGARHRFQYVVSRMKHEGYIPDDMVVEFPEVKPAPEPETTTGVDGVFGHVVSMALAELEAKGISRGMLHNVGADIQLTINSVKQNTLRDLVVRSVGNTDLRVAAVTVDANTGGVVALFGGNNGLGFNYATHGQMTGSTAKVFTLAAAMERGVSLGATFSSDPYVEGSHTLTNSSSPSCKQCTIQQATVESLNTPFLRLQNSIGGASETQNMAFRLGVPKTLVDGGEALGGAEPLGGIVLGQYQTAPVDMAGAYNTLAGNGLRKTTHVVSGVVSQRGHEVFVFAETPEPVVSESTVGKVNQALAGVAAFSNGNQIASGRGMMKTGTVQLGNTGQNRDAWAVGYEPGVKTTAVWFGTDNGDPLIAPDGSMVWGATLPASLWKNIMNTI